DPCNDSSELHSGRAGVAGVCTKHVQYVAEVEAGRANPYFDLSRTGAASFSDLVSDGIKGTARRGHHAVVVADHMRRRGRITYLGRAHEPGDDCLRRFHHHAIFIDVAEQQLGYAPGFDVRFDDAEIELRILRAYGRRDCEQRSGIACGFAAVARHYDAQAAGLRFTVENRPDQFEGPGD